MERSLDQAAGPIQLENHPANFVVLSGKASDLGVQLDALGSNWGPKRLFSWQIQLG